jgi:hypothetical protein
MIEYPDFLNAMRAGRVGETVRREWTPTGDRIVIRPVDQRLDWAVHNYAFPTIEDMPDEFFWDVRERGVELFKAGQLRLPFSPVVYMVAAGPHLGGTMLYRLTDEDDRRFAVAVYQWQPQLNGAVRICSGWIAPSPDDPTDLAFRLIPPRVESVEALQGPTVAAVQNGVTLTALLTLPQAEPLLELTLPDSAKLDEINRGRALGSRPRLVPQERIIRIRVDEANRIVWRTGPRPHGSPSPHDRAGHHRRLKNGGTTWVSGSKVLGGAPVPPSTTVVVA